MYFHNKILSAIPSPVFLGKRWQKEFSVLIPFINTKNQKENILFELRSQSIRQRGEICFPGGEIESEDISPEAAARRETAEELGISNDKIMISSYLGDLIANSGALIHVYLGKLRIDDLSELKPNKEEVEKIISVPAEFFFTARPEIYTSIRQVIPENFPAAELKLPAKYHKPWTAGRSNIYVYNYNGTIIWGLTAAILYEIVSISLLSDSCI
ncbi:MAG: CoA pyrophosphatase [Spirochaetia bacterium]|nr:CoA pyrophosphatase [Spirochaetia bacterium]